MIGFQIINGQVQFMILRASPWTVGRYSPNLRVVMSWRPDAMDPVTAWCTHLERVERDVDLDGGQYVLDKRLISGNYELYEYEAPRDWSRRFWELWTYLAPYERTASIWFNRNPESNVDELIETAQILHFGRVIE